jgi:hypothetical protein
MTIWRLAYVRYATGWDRSLRARPLARRRAPERPLSHPQGSNLARAGFRYRKGDGGDRKRPSAAAERTAAGRRSSPELPCRAFSELGRFNSLIVGFIPLFVRFICLFGRVGNLHSGVLQYQYLGGTGRVARPPGIGFFAVFSWRPREPDPGRLTPPSAPSAGGGAG